MNTTLSGALIATTPIALPCYRGSPSYSPAACEIIAQQWSNATFQANNPVGLDYPISTSCPPLTNITSGSKGSCTLGTNPVYAVNATKVEDVVKALKFAKKYHIRVVIKTTGHDLLGRSDGYGSLEIWLRYLRTGIKFQDTYTPSAESHCRNSGAWDGAAIRIGGGYTWGDVYPVAKKNSVVVVGGGTPTVGAIGGWMQGGGHGPASREFGLGADQVLEATIVLANGSIVTASPCQNEELFWAVRGGGPGTYGVVVQTVVKAWPMVNVTVQHLAIAPLASDVKPLLEAVTILYGAFPALNDAGYAGYGTWSIASPAPLFANFTAGYVHGIYMFNRTQEEAELAFQSTLEKLTPYNMTSLFISVSYVKYPDYWSFYYIESGVEPPAGYQFPDGIGGSALGSRLFSRLSVKNLTSLREMVGIIAGMPDEQVSNSLELVSGGQAFRDTGSAVNPAWRESYFSNIVSRGWKPATSDAEIEKIRKDITYVKTGAMKKQAPETGAYMNEADRLDPEFEVDFYGKSYDRLAAIKEEVDPVSLFYCPTCVGSREWVVDGVGRLCKR